jgi:hypothetical protein
MKPPIWLRQLGWPGALGAVALCFAVWYVALELPRQQAQAEQLASDGRRLRHELLARDEARRQAEAAAAEALAKGGFDVNAGPRALWSRLWQDLPDAAQGVALQRAVLKSAQDAGVTLSAVQLRGEAVSWSEAGGRRLWRQRLVMPVQTSYPQLRTWLALLAREPALSIDSLDIQRSDALSDQVRCQLNVSLWWRQEGGR